MAWRQTLKERSPRSLCALLPYPLGISPSQRFRIEQWSPYLESSGISIDFLPFADARLMSVLHQPGFLTKKAAGIAAASARRFSQLFRLRRYDAILVHRAACLAGPALLERLISLTGLPIIFDFDDAIHVLHTSTANTTFGWLKFPGKTAAICRLSAHVVVGNSYLADYARNHNRRVTIIPSSVDTGRYRPVEKAASNEPLVVGWMGTSTSQTHLEGFAPVLKNLSERLSFELRVVSDREPSLPGVPFTWRRWSAETETRDLAEFDVSIMPMPDDQWARGKCAMKALLYMSMGVPVICSAVGANREVIEHGRNGLLASTPQDWLAHMETLIADRGMRERLGAAGRLTVEGHYSAQRCAASFASVVEATLQSHRGANAYESPSENAVAEGHPAARS